MQIIFKSSSTHAQQLRVAAIRRVRFALRRLSWLSPDVQVQLSEASGQPGSPDKRCRIELATKSGPPVVVTSLAKDWISALQSALSRAVRALMHSLQSSRQRDGALPALAQSPKL